MMAMTMTTGTKMPATLSAILWMGARSVALQRGHGHDPGQHGVDADLSASIVSAPLPLMVPPMTGSPVVLVTGIDSPVTKDSSTAERPSMTVHRQGRLRLADAEPVAALDGVQGISSSSPLSVMRRAVLGLRSSSA